MQFFLAFFCAGIAFFAWQSWRRNLLYSLKSTLMDAAVILLGLALAAGFSELIAFHLPSQSPAVITLCCMVLVVAITNAVSIPDRRRMHAGRGRLITTGL